ncbi:hypothetical protein SAMN05518801_1063 [Novosphingobium sp. CF614]|uniref:antitoxin Xre/MbcA/ParS toxin-binding domain-containing protein n=1 Tax=Novosphingobium sp. CF614 TaxID=1884364 RepID=UPI0008E5FF88|nr:antitoxin Xre/MbcA/ParS toxin-binding domain-containing protein [Novosphingobium sp. CF614]SFG03326.1 hypothetical protein SAMN05518801_1063 [Novosphingobium sp. CF614]
MRRLAGTDATHLRHHRMTFSSIGRQWDACPRDSDHCRRRDEVSRLAFLLLGGRRAAYDFLNTPCAGLAGMPLKIAMTSALGQLQVSLLIRRLAIKPHSPHAQG